MASEAKWTPGPWAWFGSPVGNQMYLATTHSGRRYVMGFRRWGTQGAQPYFQVNSRLVPASDLVTFEVGEGKARGIDEGKADPSVYRLNIDGIDHPDARLIAAAPDMADALEAVLACAQSLNEEMTAAYEKARAALARAESTP